jgi:hypothetical protein
MKKSTIIAIGIGLPIGLVLACLATYGSLLRGETNPRDLVIHSITNTFCWSLVVILLISLITFIIQKVRKRTQVDNK